MIWYILTWVCIVAVPFHLWGFFRANGQGRFKTALGFLIMLTVVCIVGLISHLMYRHGA